MINQVKVTNHLGESLIMELRNPGNTGFFIRGIDGLGPSKSIINVTESPSLDGVFYNSSRVSSRNIVMDLGFMDNDPGLSIETIRQQTYRYFPLKKELVIEIFTDNRNAMTTGYVESNEPLIFSKEESTLISLLCPSAYLYGSEYIESTFTGTTPSFEFPWGNESTSLSLLEMGVITISTTKSVFYTGDESTGVVITVDISGAVNNLTIFNVSNGQQMAINSAKIIALTGSNFVAGDKIIISTIKGNKYIYLIRNGVTINILNALGITADWFTIDRGDNVFTYTAASGLSNMQFKIEHRLVYQGI